MTRITITQSGVINTQLPVLNHMIGGDRGLRIRGFKIKTSFSESHRDPKMSKDNTGRVFGKTFSQ